MRNGRETKSDINQIIAMTIEVLCLITRTRNGHIIATNRSQEIAVRVNTVDVKHVTEIRRRKSQSLSL
jgi:hypothetical protein